MTRTPIMAAMSGMSLLALVACRASILVESRDKRKSPFANGSHANTGDFELSGVSPLVVFRGQTVTLEGRRFGGKLTAVASTGDQLAVQITSDTSASFALPSHWTSGRKPMTIRQGTKAKTVTLLYIADQADRPVISAEPERVCAGVAYYDGEGRARTGSMACAQSGLGQYPAPCARDGQVACIATASHKAANVSAIKADSVMAGKVIAGVPGRLAPCAADGQTDCLANTAFKAADMTKAIPNHIASAVTIAGVIGASNLLAACTSDGQTNCASSADFPAADANALAPAKIKRGVTIAGVTGTRRDMLICRNGRGMTSANGSRTTPYDGTMSGTLLGATVSVTQNSTTITGSTIMLGLNLGVGHVITVNGESRVITNIVSFTSYTVDAPFTQASASGQDFLITRPASADLTVDDRQGNGVAGSASGTVTVTAGQTAVTGVGTAFTSELAIGDYITVNGEERTVVAIGDDTSLTVNGAFAASAANAAYATVNYYAPGSNCDVRNFADVSGSTGLVPDAGKNAAWKAVFQDKLTGLYLTNVLSTAASWTMAVDACAALNGGTAGSGWRLPTQKELMQLHIDGISHMGDGNQSAFGRTGAIFWSSTLNSSLASMGLAASLSMGSITAFGTGGSGNSGYVFMCVRE